MRSILPALLLIMNIYCTAQTWPFTEPQRIMEGSEIGINTCADLDNDGDMDWFCSGVMRENLGGLVFSDKFSYSQYEWINLQPEVQDMNNDGLRDIIFSNFNSYSMAVNLGDLQFDTMNIVVPLNLIPGFDIAEDPSWRLEEYADFNNDGYRDMLVTTHFANELPAFSTFQYYLLLTGPGGEIESVHYINSGNSSFGSITIRSVTGINANYDDYRDIACIDQAGSLKLYLHDGSGNFTQETSVIVNGLAYNDMLVTDDLNSDNFDDLLVMNSGTGISIFLGNGSSGIQFSNNVLFSPNDSEWAYGRFRLVDINNNGMKDYVPVIYIMQDQYWLDLVNNSGTATTYTLEGGAIPDDEEYLHNMADINNDGLGDLIYNKGYYRLNLGGDNYGARTRFATAPTGNNEILFNFNGDEYPDIYAVTYWDLYGNGNAPGSIWVNDGGNGFTYVLPAPGPSSSVMFADLNGDGLDDLITKYIFPGVGYTAQLNNEDLTFQTAINIDNLPLSNTTNIAFADMDLDGIMDLVYRVSNWNESFIPAISLGYMTGNNDGTFNTPIELYSGTLNDVWESPIKIADMNGDLYPDIICDILEIGSPAVMLNINGTIGEVTYLGTYYSMRNTIVEDINADGFPEVIAIGDMSENLIIIPNNGDGTFGETRFFEDLFFPANMGYAELSDLNGDGFQDIFMTWATGLSVIYGRSEIANITGIEFFEDEGTGDEYMFDVADLNADGISDLIFGRSSTIFSLNSGIFISYGTMQNLQNNSGVVFNDLNGDGTLGVGETGLYQIPVKLDNGVSSYTAFTNIDGTFEIALPEGSYAITLLEIPAGWQLTTPALNVTINESNPFVSDLLFGLQPIETVYDIEANIYSGFLVCNRDVNQSLHVTSQGNIPTSGSVTYTSDPSMIFLGSEPAPEDITGDIYTWSYSGLDYNETFHVVLTFHVPGSEFVDSTFNFQMVAVASDGIAQVDTDIADEDGFSQLRCSYDPNDITEHTGHTDNGYVISDSELRYTIRFQNTGTAPAEDVRLENQLSTLLDRNTLQPIASSHDYDLLIDDDGTAVFTFNQINLADSTSDEVGSHGFITYSIHPVEGLSGGAIIQNSADIFFDLNDPVSTNTEINNIYDCADLEQTMISATEVCSGDMITASNDAIWIDDITWYLNGTSSLLQNVAFELLEDQILEMNVSNELCSFTQTWNLHPVIVEATFTQDQNMLTAAAGSSYQWYLNGALIDGADSQLYEIMQTGDYSVLVTDNNGCNGMSDAETVIFTNLEEKEKGALTVYPNPASETAVLMLPTCLMGHDVVITNEVGQEIMRIRNISAATMTLDCLGFSKGVYNISIGENNVRLLVN